MAELGNYTENFLKTFINLCQIPFKILGGEGEELKSKKASLTPKFDSLNKPGITQKAAR